MSLCRLIALIVEKIRRANAKSQGIGMHEGLEQDIHLYSNVVDGCRVALGEVMCRDKEASSSVEQQAGVTTVQKNNAVESALWSKVASAMVAAIVCLAQRQVMTVDGQLSVYGFL